MAIASKRTSVDDLSRRGRSNIAAMMSPVPKAMLEGNRSGPRPNCSADEPVENGLIGDEVLDMCKAAIEKDLSARVSIQNRPGWLRSLKRKRKRRSSICRCRQVSGATPTFCASVGFFNSYFPRCLFSRPILLEELTEAQSASIRQEEEMERKAVGTKENVKWSLSYFRRKNRRKESL